MTEPIREQPVRSLGEIKEVLHSLLPSLQQRYRVRSLWIFGSWVRGEQSPESDLDVLVEFDEAPNLFSFVALQNELSDSLGIPIDLVMRSALKPRIGQRIEREVVPV